MKITIRGTKATQYLDGEYEDKNGRIISAQEIPGVYEQTARVRFESGEERSIITEYIDSGRPVRPKRYAYGDEVLVLGGKHKGKVLLVRADDEDYEVVVSPRADLMDIYKVHIGWTVPLEAAVP